MAYYRHADWLGSSRLTSTASRTVYSDAAYAPFGETYAQSGTADASFTGMNQDTVPTVEDFPAREYGSLSGRWASPDPLGVGAVDPADPQSWNRYAYVRNSPLTLTDPDGLEASCLGGAEDCSVCYRGGGCGDLQCEMDGIPILCSEIMGPIMGGAPEPSSNNPGCTWDSGTNTLACPAPDPNAGLCVKSLLGCGGTGTGNGGGGSSPGFSFSPQTLQKCMSGYQKSTAGKVIRFGSFLSFTDNFRATLSLWSEAIGTKYAYFKVMEVVGQSLHNPGEVTPITTVVKPTVGKVATTATLMATTADLMARGTCAMEASPDLANMALQSVN